MQANQPQGGDAEAITPTFAIGDKVTYVKCTPTAHGYNLSARSGVITEIVDQVATVKARNGRPTIQPLSKLTPEGQPNALTKALLGDR